MTRTAPLTLHDISVRAFMDESAAVDELLAHVKKLATLDVPIMARASRWTRQIRDEGIGHGVEAFLHAYGLNTSEGVALMCLAEALLRIPDSQTADALIRDTFEGRNWKNYIGKEDSWLVNLSSWGLLMTGTVVDFGQETSPAHGAEGMFKTIKKLVSRTGEPVIREALKKAMTLIGGQFVLGQTITEALSHSKGHLKQGYRFSYDILGEGARSDMQAQHYVRSYIEGLSLIGKSIPQGTSLFEAPGISVKLSALHPRYQLYKQQQVMDELLPRLVEILLKAKEVGIAVAIDAEETSRLDIELMLFETLLTDPRFAGWNGIGIVVQAYQKRAFTLIDWLAQLAEKHGRIIPIRLVKGAYWDSEIKWAQMLGLPGYPVYTRKAHTDLSYLACADKILSYRDAFYPQFATHNARTVSSIMEVANHYEWDHTQYEFQRLHGMGEALHDMVIKEVPSRIYAPVGAHKDLLAYLIRRLLENGANSSFVHLLMDKSKTPEEILADPVAATIAGKDNTSMSIPLPIKLYGESRLNSSGIDFGNKAQLDALTNKVKQHMQTPLAPIHDDTQPALLAAIAKARAAFPAWATISADDRARVMERMADLLEKHLEELIALCCSEAKKTLVDGVAEIREAADFCRYYALQARILNEPLALTSPAGESNQLSLHPRGIFGCISPWNFPLAIFTGQVCAALVTGNCVIAKPAEQTPRIAKRALELFREAGLPNDVLQLIIGDGSMGAALVSHSEIDGIVFTGSSETAKHIQKSLADRNGPIVPLIAETGGQNCMVIDSSALHEQAVDDVILSAFGSTGQRCSALRVLYLQEDIADDFLKLLKGAMQELTLGDVSDPATDIGPVIDKEAQAIILAHIERMRQSATFIAAAPMPSGLTGTYIAPHVFEIHSISELEREVFGPVLHVVRFQSGHLPQVIHAINSTGYGLTFGIHSRIDDHVTLLSSQVKAGNIYVNRGMTGATVGVQPFGGEGLSGTGPKVGGPYYLLRFLTERTTTINTAAIGGNVSLLSS
jgi:RHH-type transcriptional regulator, proline utilization regulon repressor / proline dehydrogenase / delta 1-pyrroline-5-carboxylate dehydrogenase